MVLAKSDQEEFENIKWVIRIDKSKKNRQYNGQKKKGQKDNQRSTKHTHKADTVDYCFRTVSSWWLRSSELFDRICIIPMKKASMSRRINILCIMFKIKTPCLFIITMFTS